MEIKKLTENNEKRFKNIKELANDIQDKKMCKAEIRQCAESIELLADTKWIKCMNKAIQNITEGHYITEKEFINEIKKK